MPPGRDDAARSRWQEWVIAGAIGALLVTGVAAIWGAPIKGWIDDLGGDSAEPSTTVPRPPEGRTL
jgi:hypothetical protein